MDYVGLPAAGTLRATWTFNGQPLFAGTPAVPRPGSGVYALGFSAAPNAIGNGVYGVTVQTGLGAPLATAQVTRAC